MPYCQKCNNFYPPNYTEVIQNSKPDLNNNYPQQCIFCKLGIDKVERETSHNSSKYIMYSKEECIRDYKEFLKKIKNSRNVQDIIKKSEELI